MDTGVSKQKPTATPKGTAKTRGTLDQKTLENLSTAMHGEALAYVKYLLYAENARKSGNKELADLFEKTANTERFEHFAEEAQLAGLVGSDADNLKDAIEGESYEVDAMYPEFAQKAKLAGDTAAAARFEETGAGYYGYSRYGSRGGMGIAGTVLLIARVLYLIGAVR
jgi:Rubrerythrin